MCNLTPRETSIVSSTNHPLTKHYGLTIENKSPLPFPVSLLYTRPYSGVLSELPTINCIGTSTYTNNTSLLFLRETATSTIDYYSMHVDLHSSRITALYSGGYSTQFNHSSSTSQLSQDNLVNTFIVEPVISERLSNFSYRIQS